MIKTVHFISFSPCGGTEKVSHAIARDISLPKKMHNITLSKNRENRIAFGEEDLVFLAFPVIGGRMPRFFGEFISILRGNGTPLVLVSVYGNRAYEGSFLDMDKGLRPNGFNPVAAIAAVAEHSLNPLAATGRPDADDAGKLAGFGCQALEKAQGGGGIAAPGKYPAWSLPPGIMPLFPETDADACTRCGACVGVCPNKAIPADSPDKTLLDKCIVCAACIKYCPAKARTIGFASPEIMKEMARHRDAMMLERKEPEMAAI